MSIEGQLRLRVAELEKAVERYQRALSLSYYDQEEHETALSRARAEERERCAQIAESVADTWHGSEEHRAAVSATAFAIVDAIRASDPTPPHRRSALEHERDAGEDG